MAETIDVKLNFDDTELIKGLSDLQKSLRNINKEIKKSKIFPKANDEAREAIKAAKKVERERIRAAKAEEVARNVKASTNRDGLSMILFFLMNAAKCN